MKKLAFIGIVLVGFCQHLHAQTHSTLLPRDQFFVGYEVAIPSNSNYLTKISWAGLLLDYRRMITPNISVGAAMRFNSFEQYFIKQTYLRTDNTGSVTSDMIRQIYNVPITANVHYYFPGNELVKTYIGIGVGAQYSEQDAYFNIYNINVYNWGFVMRPEMGAVGKIKPNISLFINLAYNYATNTNSSFHIDHLSQFPISVGFVFSAP
ncbi:hypothetical protein ACFGVR_10955 [Mucilaginibacter sp. AW1-3]